MTKYLIPLILSGCGHITTDLKAHEESHCREFGVPESKWEYHYDGDMSVCYREHYLFVQGCTSVSGDKCEIHLPRK